LPCQYVIHAVGPIWGEGDEDQKLHDAVHGALRLAESYEIASLGLPAISTGIFGFPKERGAGVIVNAILRFFEDNPVSTLKDIRIVLVDKPSLQVFADEFVQRWGGSVLKL
jgi:O-acetyl-ADP-ribose deacetylase (regulator of RNase III)